MMENCGHCCTGPPLVPERRRAAARPRDGHGARLPAGGQEGRGEVSAQTPAHGGNTSQVFSVCFAKYC